MADRASLGKPIEAGIIERVVRGIKYAIDPASASSWFGPNQPLQPVAQEQAKGRALDYPVGFNTRFNPRSEEAVSFSQLRALADGYDLLRLIIETRKDQIMKMKWSVSPIDGEEESDDRCTQIEDLLRFPDQEHDWHTWLRMLLEDMLTIDAATIYPRMTLGGDVYSFELVDGATIKRVIDDSGRTPLPPQPAYQQVLKGIPAVDYSRDELVYRPRNVRTHKLYGYSPVEQIIMTVNIALRRQVSTLEYYTEGNIPEALIGVPESWNPDQISQFQLYWDSLLEGNTAQRRHAKFVPAGVGKDTVFTREPDLKGELDEWLARVVCFALSVSPQPFVKQMNRATADTAQEAALEEGLAPVMLWVKSTIDYLIWKYFGYKDLEFKWDEEEAIDPKVQADINKIYLDADVLHPDEVRADLGREPLSEEQKSDMAPAPIVGLDGEPINGQQPPNAGIAGKKKPPIPGKEEEPVEKSLRKYGGKKKGIKPIKRDRLLIKEARTKAKRIIKKVLKREAKNVSHQIAVAFDILTKADEDTVDRILNAIRLNGFDVLAGDDSDLAEVLAQVAKDGAAQALKQIGIDDKGITEQVNELAVKYASDRSAELVGKKLVDGDLVDNPRAEWSIDDGTREMLRTDVTLAIDQGWSNSQLAGAIEDNYAFSDARAELIARTETAFADVAGNMLSYRESGEVEGKAWILGGDPCDVCVTNSEQGVIDLDEDFESGDDAPPAHPNCECDVVPILRNEEQGS